MGPAAADLTEDVGLPLWRCPAHADLGIAVVRGEQRLQLSRDFHRGQSGDFDLADQPQRDLSVLANELNFAIKLRAGPRR